MRRRKMCRRIDVVVRVISFLMNRTDSARVTSIARDSNRCTPPLEDCAARQFVTTIFLDHYKFICQRNDVTNPKAVQS